MTGILEGFATIGVVIALGALLAQLQVVDLSGALVLSKVSFFLASPALMLSLVSRTDVSHVLSRQLVATVAGVLVPLTIYVACARWVWRRGLGHTVIGGLCSSYVNAGNLGLPVAAYALGDVTYVVPTLLLQLVVITPICVGLLDHDAARSRARTALLLPLANPLTIAVVLGLLLSLTSTPIPGALAAPLDLVGAMAVPSMLVAYGISLRLGGGFGSGGSTGEIALVSSLKLVVQPTVATLAGTLLGLSGTALLAVAVLSALPTAQNVFTHATRYGRGQLLARDTILVTTSLCVPLILVIVAVLG
ncbi:putative transport integral membrane protein [metagenome]|uniref:Putative transport integral membrane protein n=1 Tax=metagenome TaxID=256318 RepID=A0A2P2BZN9_9ZZZZ